MQVATISSPNLSVQSAFTRVHAQLKIEFVFRNTSDQTSPAPHLDLNQIAVSESLLDRLMMAAELHSATVLKNCLRDLEQTGVDGKRLAQTIYASSWQATDMETIQRIVAQIRRHSLAGPNPPSHEQRKDPCYR